MLQEKVGEVNLHFEVVVLIQQLDSVVYIWREKRRTIERSRNEEGVRIIICT